jgi:glycosyltransferase involved in cell wall biosynthesis
MMSSLQEWKLFIVGDGPDKDKLLKLVKDLKLNNRVFILGKMERKDLLKRIQKSEIFILNTSFESFSFQVVEAMRAKTPVITTKIGNLSEIIEDGKEGILVEPNNTNEIVEAIQKFAHYEFRHDVVEKAFIKSEKFSIQNTLEETSKTIIKLITNKKI